MPAFPWLFDVKAMARGGRIGSPPAGIPRTHGRRRRPERARARAGGLPAGPTSGSDRGLRRGALMLAGPFSSILAQQIAGVTPVGSRTLPVYGTPCVASTHTWLDMVLVAAGVIAVVVTTFYTLLYLIRPGETSEGRTSSAAFWRTEARDPDDRGAAERIDIGRPRDRIDIFLDGAAEPSLSTTPPLSFELDTSLMEDGPHTMLIEAYDDLGVRGTAHNRFQRPQRPRDRRRGHPAARCPRWKNPGHRERLWGNHGGRLGTVWGETPAPAPTWAWVLLIVVVAFGIFYGVQQWSPSGEFALTPTYGAFGRPRRVGRSGGRRRSARTYCHGRAGREHAAGFDRAVSRPGAGCSAWRGTLLGRFAPPVTRIRAKASPACSRR